MVINTVDPHYLWILYLQYHLGKFICNLSAFMVIPGHVESSEKWELPTMDTSLAKAEPDDSLPSCFGPHTVDE